MASKLTFFRPLRDFLFQADSPEPANVIFVLAGRHERKGYGLQLFRDGLAPRLILSVGRFEVRNIGPLGFDDLKLRDLAARLPPDHRHFFIDIVRDSRRVITRTDAGKGTYAELLSLSRYLAPERPSSILLVSTSIHLRRIRFCCRRIVCFAGIRLRYLSVPEHLSSFRRDGWWKRRDQWSFLIMESLKLAGYRFRYGSTKRSLARLANSSLAYRDGIESQAVKGEGLREGERK
jgi:hypothetical protein